MNVYDWLFIIVVVVLCAAGIFLLARYCQKHDCGGDEYGGNFSAGSPH